MVLSTFKTKSKHSTNLITPINLCHKNFVILMFIICRQNC